VSDFERGIGRRAVKSNSTFSESLLQVMTIRKSFLNHRDELGVHHAILMVRFLQSPFSGESRVHRY